MSHKIFITGAAGYVGTMLVEKFSERPDVEVIIGLDKEPIPEILKGNSKLTYIQANTSEESWMEDVKRFAPDIVIHTAWNIREMYGDRETTWKWNVLGSDNIFKLAFSLSSVKRLIHFSTVASYGAYPSNTVDHFFTEDEEFRKTDYLYAEEKRIAEERLKSAYEKAEHKPQVLIVRPAAITGPRGRYMRIRFGLQSALSGKLQGSPFYKIINALVSFVPATRKWLRQFVHEDDVVDIVEKLSFDDLNMSYEAFNLAPPGDVVRAKDMGRAVGKKVIILPPWMIRIAFFIMWHISRGVVTTSPGGWKSYSYPIAVDGSKVTRLLGHHYKHNSLDAFTKTDGRYEKYVPETDRS
jgi:nucleoside-diphosphate-sugar epimerase